MAENWKSRIAGFFEKTDEKRGGMRIFTNPADYKDFLNEFLENPRGFEHLQFLEGIVPKDKWGIISQIIKNPDIKTIWRKLYNALQLDGLKNRISPLFDKGNIFKGHGIAGVSENDAAMARSEDGGNPLDRNIYKQMVDNLKKHEEDWSNFLRVLGVENGNGPSVTLEPFGINLQNFRDQLDAVFDDFRVTEPKHFILPPVRQHFDAWREELESAANTFFEKLTTVEDNWLDKERVPLPFDKNIENFKSLFDAVLFNSPAAKKYFETLNSRYKAEGDEAKKYNFYDTDERQNSAVALASFLAQKAMSKKEKSGEKNSSEGDSESTEEGKS